MTISRKHTRHGYLFYPSNDSQIGRCLDRYGEWCFPEIEFTRKYATRNVIDVGANIGTHACVYAQDAKHVYAFEALTGIFDILCQNIPSNCTAYNVAIGEKDGETTIPFLDFNKNANFGASQIGTGMHKIPMKTIDSYHFSDISLLKIDVEGYELEVIKGAKETIEQSNPALFVECDKIEKFDSLYEYIESMGYSIIFCKCPIGPNEPFFSMNLLCVREQ